MDRINAPMNEEHDITDSLLSHGGWFATAVVGIWGWLLKMALSRHLIALDKVNARLDAIEMSIARLQGRFDQMDGHGE